MLWECFGVIRGVVWEMTLVSLGGPVASRGVYLGLGAGVRVVQWGLWGWLGVALGVLWGVWVCGSVGVLWECFGVIRGVVAEGALMSLAAAHGVELGVSQL